MQTSLMKNSIFFLWKRSLSFFCMVPCNDISWFSTTIPI